MRGDRIECFGVDIASWQLAHSRGAGNIANSVDRVAEATRSMRF